MMTHFIITYNVKYYGCYLIVIVMPPHSDGHGGGIMFLGCPYVTFK